MTTLTFSQGIVSHSTNSGLPGDSPNFLVSNGDKVDLHAPLAQPFLSVFAQRDANYLLTLQANSDIQTWGYGNLDGFNAPMSNTNGGGPADNEHYLWIGINRVTGEAEYGYSKYEPFSGVTPQVTSSSRPDDTHWFDRTNNVMKVWRTATTPGPGNYGAWTEVIRVFVAKYIFAGSFTSLSINSPSFIGTSAGLEGTTRAGALVFDVGGKPVLRTDQSNVSLFFTTEDIFTSGLPAATSPLSGSRARFETFIVDAIGIQPMAAFTMVRFSDFNEIMPLTAATQPDSVYGMIEYPVNSSGDLTQVTLSGLVRNPLWQWDVVSQQIYVDKDNPGILTTIEDGYVPYTEQLPIGVAVDETSLLLRRPELAFYTGPNTGGVTDHNALTNIGLNTHDQIDTHISDATLHFTEAAIDHVNILNIGSNSHDQIDIHILDSTVHFTEAAIDHDNILNNGTNTHAQLDSHVASTTNPHSTTLSLLSDTTITGAVKGDILVYNGSAWVDLDVGADGEVLTANSADPTGINWAVNAGGSGSPLPTFNLVDDLTPQLGGTLDINGQFITSVVSGSFSGDIDLTSGAAPGASGYDGGGVNITTGAGDGTGYGGSVSITAAGSYYGGSLQFEAGSGTYAGYIGITSGDSINDDAGGIDIIAGSNNTNPAYSGGNVNIEGGANISANGAAVRVNGGGGSYGGNLQLVGGTHATGFGGDIILKPGNGQTVPNQGKVYVMGNSNTATPGELRIHTDANLFPDATHYVGLTVDTMPASVTYTLPAAPSVGGQVLTSTTGGIMSWTTPTGLDNIVEDLTPQLGANLDVNGFDIVSVGGTNIDVTSSDGSSGPGGSISIVTGDGDGSNPGGNLVVSGGTGGAPLGTSAGYGAAVKVESGRGGTSLNYSGGHGGLLEIFSGRGGTGSNFNVSTGGDGGDIHMYAGDGAQGRDVSGAGGSINIFAGNGFAESGYLGAVGNVGGDVVISSGDGSYVSDAGDIILQPGQSILGGDGEVQLRSSVSSTSGSVAFMDNDDSNSVTLAAPGTVTTNRTWVLPQDDPSTVSGQFLTTDASGVLSFSTAGSGKYTETGAFTASVAKTITHSLGNKYVLVQIYDSSDDQIGAQLVHLVDTNSLQVTLNATLAGVTVVVIG